MVCETDGSCRRKARSHVADTYRFCCLHGLRDIFLPVVDVNNTSRYVIERIFSFVNEIGNEDQIVGHAVRVHKFPVQTDDSKRHPTKAIAACDSASVFLLEPSNFFVLLPQLRIEIGLSLRRSKSSERNKKGSDSYYEGWSQGVLET
jgi:hypothetical protein